MLSGLKACALWCALAVLAGASASAQVQPDDGGGPGGAAGVLVVGVNACRFDHRSPRALDVDEWALATEPGRVYGVRVELIDDQSEALGREHPSNNYIRVSEGVLTFPISGGQAWCTAEGVLLRVLVSGLARSDGSSARYRIVVDDRGLASDPEGTSPLLLVDGAWAEGTLEPATVSGEGRDYFRFAGVAGRRYRVELEGNVGVSATTTATGFVQSRDGDVVFALWRRVAGSDPYLPYRVRFVDMGAEPGDDHGNRPEEATPFEADGEWRRGYSHVIDSDSSPLLGDWFALRVVAGHAYEVRTRAVAPAQNGAYFAVMRDDGLLDFSLMLMAITGHETRVARFRATADGVRRFVVPPRWERFSYELRAVDLGAFEDDVGDRLSGIGALSVGGAVNGVLEHGADVDAFELVGVGAGAGGRYRVSWTAGSTTGAPLRVLVDPLTGSPVAWSGGIAVSPSLEISVNPGERRRVTVSRVNAAGGPDLPVGLPPVAYTVTLSYVGPLPQPLPPVPDDYPDTAEGAPLVPVGQAVYTTRSSNQDVDVARVVLQPGRRYRAINDYAVVRDAGGNAVASDSPSASGATSGQFMVPAMGEYTVHSGGSGNLGIEDMGAATDDQPTFAPARKVEVGTTTGQIEFSYDQDRFYVEVEDGVGYDVVLDAPGAGSAVWRQYEPGWNGVSIDEFGVRRLWFTVRSATVPAGGYGYTVTVHERWREHPSEDQRPAAEGGSPLVVGVPALVVWRDYLDEDALAFDVVAGHVYRFVVTSPGMDSGELEGLSYFELRGPTGEMIASGPHGGDGPVRAGRDERWMLVAGFEQGAVLVRVEDMGVGEDDCGPLPAVGGRLIIDETRRGVWERAGDVDGWLIEGADDVELRVELIPDGGAPSTVYPVQGAFVMRAPTGTSAFPRGYSLRAYRVCAGDIGRAGAAIGSDGFRDANDLALFIDRYFRRSTAADIGGVGGQPVPDGQWDVNDFVVFIEQFFSPCG